MATETPLKATKRVIPPPTSARPGAAPPPGRTGPHRGANGSLPPAGNTRPTGNVYKPQCPAQKALETIASKWAILVMHSLMDGPMRFNALQRKLQGVSQKVLTQQLRKLEKTGLITRSVHPTVPPSVEYALTPAGRELKAALSGLCAWANKHAALLGLSPNEPLAE